MLKPVKLHMYATSEDSDKPWQTLSRSIEVSTKNGW